MFFRISGDGANVLIEEVTKFLASASRLMTATTQRLEWEVELHKRREPQTDKEIENVLRIEQLELQARDLKAKAEFAEYSIRHLNAAARLAAHNRTTHASKPRTRSTQERSVTVEGKMEGKVNQSLSDTATKNVS